MGLSQFIAGWTVRGIARTQFRLFKLTQQKSPGVPEHAIAPLILGHRFRRTSLSSAEAYRGAAYFEVNPPPRTLREACHAIAVIEFKIDPLDVPNVTYLTGIIDSELEKLGYVEECPEQ